MDDNTTTPNPAEFNVLSFLDSIEYPTSFVTVFTNVAPAKEYADLVRERGDIDDPEMDEKIEAAAEKLKGSALTFKLKGYAPGKVDSMIEEFTPKDGDQNESDPHLIAEAIESVKAPNGATDTHKWTHEEVRALKFRIPEGEYLKLLRAVAEVLFTSAVVDQAVDAGFPR